MWHPLHVDVGLRSYVIDEYIDADTIEDAQQQVAEDFSSRLNTGDFMVPLATGLVVNVMHISSFRVVSWDDDTELDD